MMTITIEVLLFLLFLNYAVSYYRLTFEFAAFIDSKSISMQHPHRCEDKSDYCDYVLKMQFTQPRTNVTFSKRFPKDYESKPIFQRVVFDYNERYTELKYLFEVALLRKNCTNFSICFSKKNIQKFERGSPIIPDGYKSAKLILLTHEGKQLYIALRHTCKPSYYGKYCNTICRPANDDTLGHYKCDRNGAKVCLRGWKDPLKNCTEYAQCRSDWCHNGGTCLMENSEKHCNCKSDYIGTKCERKKTPCDQYECLHNSTCTNINSTHRNCTCKGGWTGDSCQLNANRCKALSCNHGKCHKNNKGYYCKCNEGYDGKKCDKDIDECAKTSNPVCKNGGTCTNNHGGYSCKCPFSFGGLQCEKCKSEGERMGNCYNKRKPFDSLAMTLGIISAIVVIPVFSFLLLTFLRRRKKNDEDEEEPKFTFYDESTNQT